MCLCRTFDESKTDGWWSDDDHVFTSARTVSLLIGNQMAIHRAHHPAFNSIDYMPPIESDKRENCKQPTQNNDDQNANFQKMETLSCAASQFLTFC